MLRNYLKTAIRSFGRDRLNTALNVLGLALGLACALLIALFIRSELAYDRFHAKADRIYRLASEVEFHGMEPERTASAVFAAAPAIEESVADVEHAVRFFGSALDRPLVGREDVQFYESDVYFVDEDVFEVFSYELLQGDPTTALQRPNTVVLTESSARRYFGDADPMGGEISIRGETFEVTGVMADVPDNTHLPVAILGSLATQVSQQHFQEHGWSLLGFYTYLLLSDTADPRAVGARINAVAGDYVNPEMNAFFLQPLTDIHLRSHLASEIRTNGDIRYVYLFGVIALLVLLIACVNYVNLTTARAAHRATEIGVRKVVGAGRGQLVRQFLAESVLTSLMAFVGAVGVVALVLPAFNSLTDKSISIGMASEVQALASLALMVGLFAGVYPALFMTRFLPILALKGAGTSSGRDRATLRKALVVFQFTVTITLIACTIVVQRQLDYVRQERLGFDTEHLVVIHGAQRLGESYEAFKDVVRSDASVERVTTSTNVAGQRVFNEYIMGADEETGRDRFDLTYSMVDFDFLRTLDLGLVEGRDFSLDRTTDFDAAILVNETTARKMGWEEAVGQELFGREVVGVVRDYITTSSREEVKATAFVPSAGAQRFVIVRIRPQDVSATIATMSGTWRRFVPHAPLDYSFADADIDRLYRSEQRLGQVFGAFTLLAVVIACLGLFGLSAFTAARRSKEISIRKVFGAGVLRLVSLLSRDFVLLVLAAFAIGAPISYFGMRAWLENFAYRIELSPEVFLFTGVAALAVALLTVSYQAVRAALADPIKNLRYE